MSSTDHVRNTGNGSDTQKDRPGRAVPRNQIAVARGGGMVIVRVIGAGNMLTAPALIDFYEQQFASGFRRYVFDLQSCQALDSTFMGCMVGLANLLKKEPRKEAADSAPPMPSTAAEEPVEELSPAEALEALKQVLAPGGEASAKESVFAVAINSSPEVRELLGILGVDKFVPLLGSVQLPDLETTVLPNLDMTPDQRRDMILKAHENLVEIDKRNEAHFGAFLKSLSSELSKPRPSA